MRKKQEATAAKSAPPRTSGATGTPRQTRSPDAAPKASKQRGPGTPCTPQGGNTKPPPGLDPAKQAAVQRTAGRAELIRERLFPTLLADALGYDELFDAASYQLYLERLLQDAGNPTDPIERMMYEQLAAAHFRIGQLHARAGRAEGLEAMKVLNAAAARMLGEFRRTALSLRAYRARTPEGRQKSIKIFKAAQ